MATKRYSGLLGAPFKICVRHTCHFYGGVPNQQGAKHPLFLILASKNWGFGLTPHFQRGYEAHEIPPCLPRDLLRDSFAENLQRTCIALGGGWAGGRVSRMWCEIVDGQVP